MENMEPSRMYNVTKSRAVRYCTAFVWVLVVAVSVPSWYMVFAEPFILVPFFIMLLATATVLGVLFHFYLISPRRVELAADALVLHRVRGRKEFRYADITEIGLWHGKASDMFRFCGSGAFCGFIGWFSGGGLGSHFEYVGRYDDAFYVKTRRGRAYLLSCDGADEVVEYVRGRLGDCGRGGYSRPSSE